MGDYLFPGKMAAALCQELVFDVEACDVGTYVLIDGRRDGDGA